MKRKALALMFIFSFLFSALIVTKFTNSAIAQTYSTITIKPDGSIEGTDKIQRSGNTYTLTGDILGSITVRRSGITIDGAGHTLEGRKQADEWGIDLVGHDETFLSYGTVLVKNLRIYNYYYGLFTPGSNNNSFIGNCFDHSSIHILAGGYVGNLIKNNVFINAGIFVDYSRGGLDIITENNFIFDLKIFVDMVTPVILVDLAKPPIVDRNYWSNYVAEYPNATEVDASGIWDTPYVYDHVVGYRGSHGDDPCIDYHPLVNPIEIPAFPDNTAPVISIVSPEKRTYESDNVSLAFGVNELTVWAGYSLDGEQNVTVTGNTTLMGLLDGSHSLMVYANDTFGNMGSSDAIGFTVAIPELEEPFPTSLVVAATVAVVAVVCAGLLVYFNNRKR